MPVKRTKRDLSSVLGSGESPSPTARKAARKSVSDVPSGGGTLNGLKIVVTGVPELVKREHLEGLLKKAGAQVTSAVSGVTNILILGPKLEDGRDVQEGNKFKKASELISTGKSKGGLKIYTETEFFDQYPDLRPDTMCDGAVESEQFEASSDHFLWAEKWRPRSPAYFAFNQDSYKSLEHWLSCWSPSAESEKAALLCGPPGVGKTSAVLALAEAQGYKLIEFNASDTRGQKQLKQLNALITGGMSLSKGECQEKPLILMDEADGLSSGDRGGAQELVKLIKQSRVPIVCTCNDKQHPKVRTLAKSCRVIEFKKCERLAAVKRAMRIAEKEGFTITDKFVNIIYDAADGDMRQLLNGLQSSLVARPTQPGNLQRFVLKDPNANEDAFAVVKRLFSSSSMSNRERLDAFFVDYDLIPLIIHENYLKCLTKDPKGLLRARDVSDAMCYADIINAKIRGASQWDLLPDYGFFSTVYPTKQITSSMWRVDFPKFLGRMSSTSKHKRQLGELAAKTGRAGRRLVSDGYYEILGDELMHVLREESLEPSERFEEFFENASAYGLTKDLIMENLMDLRWTRNTQTPYELVAPKVKTALTRAWNTRAAPGQIVKETKTGTRKATGRKKKETPQTPPSRSIPTTEDLDETEDEADVQRDREEEEQRMGSII